MVAGVALALAAVQSTAEDAAVKSEVDGTWKLVEYIENGTPNAAVVEAGYEIRRQNGVQEIYSRGKLFSSRKFKVNAAATPRQIDFIDDAGKVTHGIYELTDDKHRAALFVDSAKGATDRPGGFDEPGLIVATYSRVTAADPAK